MKFLFTSDKFSYIHPSLSPRKTNSYSSKDLKIAEENTSMVRYGKSILEEARANSRNSIPKNQIGSLIVFPESETKNLKRFLIDTFSIVNKTLNEEYSNLSDPTKYFDIADDGKYFSAKFENHNPKSGIETFSSKSISIYVAGCKDTTADYLFEEFLDKCFEESSKHDRKITKNGNDDSEKINFGKFRTFLVYSFQNGKFHQIGVKENEIYESPRRRKSVYDDYDIEEVSIESTLKSNGFCDIL